MSSTADSASHIKGRPRLRRAALASAASLFALLWVGGVASQWLGGAREEDGPLASLFLMLAGLVVLLGAGPRRDRAALACVALLGFAVEFVGARYGAPFGAYGYTGVLRPQLLGVPVVMGFAWMALVAYACELARRFRLPAWPAAVAAALWTTATDLVIDPLAVNHFGYWTWGRAGAYYGIPFTNFVGWFVTSLVACRVVGPRPAANAPAAFVGAAILLFFAAVALAHNFLPVALVGLGLCAAQLLVMRRRPERPG